MRKRFGDSKDKIEQSFSSHSDHDFIILKKLNEKSKKEDLENDFKASFRLLSPDSARFQAAKQMSYREGLGMYKNPKDFVHRQVILINFLY